MANTRVLFYYNQIFISQSNCCEHAIQNIAEHFSTKGSVQENSYIKRNISHEEMSLSNIM